MKRREHRPPTVHDLRVAHATFADKEARDLFYRVATELVDRAITRKTTITFGESIAVLLATWNRRFYQRGRRCDRRHVDQIDSALERRKSEFLAYRARRLETLDDAEEQAITDHFASFESFLGRVDVAKCFHLIAPNFFPLWDKEIAAEYGCALKELGKNAGQYWKFMKLVRGDIRRLHGAAAIEKAVGTPALKALDEYAYCKYTTGWI